MSAVVVAPPREPLDVLAVVTISSVLLASVVLVVAPLGALLIARSARATATASG